MPGALRTVSDPRYLEYLQERLRDDPVATVGAEGAAFAPEWLSRLTTLFDDRMQAAYNPLTDYIIVNPGYVPEDQKAYDDAVLHELRHRGARNLGALTLMEKVQAHPMFGYEGDEANTRYVDYVLGDHEAVDYFIGRPERVMINAGRRAADIGEQAIEYLSRRPR